jgi:hypothetical protein
MEPNKSHRHIDKDGEGDGQDPRHGSQGPQQISFPSSNGEGGNNDRELRAQHAEEEFLTATMMTLGGEIAFAHLQFKDIGNGLV